MSTRRRLWSAALVVFLLGVGVVANGSTAVVGNKCIVVGTASAANSKSCEIGGHSGRFDYKVFGAHLANFTVSVCDLAIPRNCIPFAQGKFIGKAAGTVDVGPAYCNEQFPGGYGCIGRLTLAGPGVGALIAK